MSAPEDIGPYLDIPEHLLQVREDLLWHAPPAVMNEFLANASESLRAIERSEDIRHVVLEAWLLLDLVLREFLLGGLGLHGVNHSEYDLRYSLLPRSLEGLLRLILRIRDVNKELQDPVPKGAALPLEFLIWLRRKERQFFDRFVELERNYLLEKHPEALPPHERLPPVYTTAPWPPPDPRRISAHWVESARQLTESWVRRARQLNKARNLAAHSHDRPSIASALGYAGDNSLVLVREHCTTLARELLGIIRLPRDGGDLDGSA